jgi:hypothetical protein
VLYGIGYHTCDGVWSNGEIVNSGGKPKVLGGAHVLALR